MCNIKSEFKECGFEENRRHECSNCSALFIPWKMRHFGNKFEGYPVWVSRNDWMTRKFVPGIVAVGYKILN